MARKGENIYKRKDGRWEGRYIKGRRADGKAKYGYVYAHRYQDVREKLTLLKVAVARQGFQKINFYGTVWEWMAYWLTTLAGPHIKESTYSSYESKIKKHVLPVLGEKKLSQIESQDIEKVVQEMDEKGMAASSICAVVRVLNNALQKAVDKRLLFLNPCEGINLPKIERDTRRVFSRDEQKKLEQAALSDPTYAAIVIAGHTGMRIGEISALKWKDVDLENGIIYVRKTLQRVSVKEESQKTRLVMGSPKTGNSNRVIPLSPHLKNYMETCKNNAASEYVVTSKGHHAEPRIISYRFHKLLRELQIKPKNFHCLRHTFATRCLEKGIDITTISALLGHASVKMTLDTYTESMIEQRKAAVAALDYLFA